MKLWKQGFAVALVAAILLGTLTACGPSGPTTPEQPGSSTGTTEPSEPGKDPEEKPGTGEAGGETGKDPTEKPDTGETGGETGKDPTEKPGKEDTEDENDKKTEEQKAIEATIKALNTVRAEYGLKAPLILNAQACAVAKQMAQVQLDGMIGKYPEQGEDSEYAKACTKLRNEKVQDKASIGFGAVYNGYPIDKTYRKWANSTNPTSAERNKALILSKDATFVGVGVVQNPDTTSEYKYMVVVMTY